MPALGAVIFALESYFNANSRSLQVCKDVKAVSKLTEVKLTRISIVRKNIRRPINHLLFLFRKIRQKVAHKLFQILRVITTQKRWIRKPSFIKVPRSLNGYRVCGGICERNFIAAVCFERDGSIYTK